MFISFLFPYPSPGSLLSGARGTSSSWSLKSSTSPIPRSLEKLFVRNPVRVITAALVDCAVFCPTSCFAGTRNKTQRIQLLRPPSFPRVHAVFRLLSLFERMHRFSSCTRAKSFTHPTQKKQNKEESHMFGKVSAHHQTPTQGISLPFHMGILLSFSFSSKPALPPRPLHPTSFVLSSLPPSATKILAWTF